MNPRDAVRIRHGETLLRLGDPPLGKPLVVPGGAVPEFFFRLELAVESGESVYGEDPTARAGVSNQFWDQSRPGRHLLRAAYGNGRSWSLSFTPWGKLRWEMVEGGDVVASVESSFTMATLVDLSAPFQVGVVLDGNPHHGRVQLVAGPGPGPDLWLVGEAAVQADSLPGGRPDELRAGESSGGGLAVRELLVANSLMYGLFDDPRPAAPVCADFPCGSARGARLSGDREVFLRPGNDFGTTRDCSWYFCRVDDPAIRTIRLGRVNGMSTTLFASEDRTNWRRLPLALAGRGDEGLWQAVARLPERAGPLYVASAPVYAEHERDRDLARCADLGCEVTAIGHTSNDLPIHLVSLTNPAVPLRQKKGVVLLCGQHSPLEQMGGHLGVPCIERLLELDRREGGLLNRMVFYWIPLFNVDCARFVSCGVDARLKNPNRCWFHDQGPEQLAVQDFFLRQRHEGLQLACMVDVHGGGEWNNHTVLADYHVALERDPRTVDLATTRLEGPDRDKAALLAILNSTAGLREVWHNGLIADTKCRAPEWFQTVFDAPAFTIECSTLSHRDPVDRRTKPFTHASFIELGGNLGTAFAAMLPGS